jgi:hypothetical protein
MIASLASRNDEYGRAGIGCTASPYFKQHLKSVWRTNSSVLLKAKRLRHLAFFTLVGLFGGVGISAASSFAGTISSVIAYGENINAVFVNINGTAGGSPPSCQNYQNNRFVLNPTTTSGQALLAVVLSALARGVPVGITGSGTCSIWPDTESILQLQSE